MPQRQPIDPCLLCQVNPATKTNSHILSRFISTNFLGPKGPGRKGFDLSSETALEKKPKTVQDSPKEDHILCDECEAYFSVMESLSSSTFVQWKEKAANGEFVRNTIKSFLDILECNSSDPAVIRLFIYSLFWRVSISSHPLFVDYKIVADFEEELRQVLLHYKALNRPDFLQKVKASVPPVYPYTSITANSFADETANVIAALYSFDPYCLLVDRFSFMLFREEMDIKIDFIHDFSNTKTGDCRIMVFSEELWDTLMVKKPIELLVKQATRQKS